MLHILKGFYGWDFTLLDLVYKIPRSLVFQSNSLNLIIKENMFGFLYNLLEFFPIL